MKVLLQIKTDGIKNALNVLLPVCWVQQISQHQWRTGCHLKGTVFSKDPSTESEFSPVHTCSTATFSQCWGSDRRDRPIQIHKSWRIFSSHSQFVTDLTHNRPKCIIDSTVTSPDYVASFVLSCSKYEDISLLWSRPHQTSFQSVLRTEGLQLHNDRLSFKWYPIQTKNIF